MAPTVTPNGSFISPYPIGVNDKNVTVIANGVDDYDNLQYVFTQLSGKTKCSINLQGTFFHRYSILPVEFDGVIQGPATIQAGKLNKRMQLLDATDQPVINPSGWPDQFTFRKSTTAATSVRWIDVKLQGTDAPGYNGTYWFGVPVKNIGLRSNVRSCGLFPVLSRHNIPLTMTGVVPQSLGVAHALSVSIFSALNGGTLYTAGVDYTVAESGGVTKVTRINGGAITDGQAVYAHHSDVNNRKTVARSDMSFLRCSFSGSLQRGAKGQLCSNVDEGFCIWGGASYSLEASPDDVSYNSVMNAADYSMLLYSVGQSIAQDIAGDIMPDTPANGLHSIESCHFSGLSVSVQAESGGLEGRPSAGPYIFGSPTTVRSSISAKSNTHEDIGTGVNGSHCYYIEQASALNVSITGDTFVNCLGVAGLSGGQNYGALERIAGWVGITNNWLISGCTADINSSVRYLFTDFGIPIIFLDQAHGSDFKDTATENSFVVSGNTLRYMGMAGKPAAPLTGIVVRRLGGVIIQHNKFVNEDLPKAETAIMLHAAFVRGGPTLNCLVSQNNFTKWVAKQSAVNIEVQAGCIGNQIDCLHTADTVRDSNGPGANTITGGTLVP